MNKDLGAKAITAAPVTQGPSSGTRVVAMLASGALFGKALGFARELLMARIFGASQIADSFRASVAAVTLPMLPFMGESVCAILIPMHRRWQEEGNAPLKLSALCLSLCGTAVFIMLLIQLCVGWYASFIVGGMTEEGQRLVREFIRLMAFWMPASVLLNCLTAAEIACGRARIAGLMPAALNLGIMAGVFLYYVTGKLGFLPLFFALAFDVLGAWAVWLLHREGMLEISSLTLTGIVEVWLEFLRRLRPLLAQPFAEQCQSWLERLVASGFIVGTLASLGYARTLTETATLMVSYPIGMAVLHKGESTPPQAKLKLAASLLCITLPSSIYLVVFAPDIVHLIFSRGAFNQTAVELTSGALRGIASGLWAITLGMILIRFLNIAGRNWRVASILAVAFLINAALNLLAWRANEAVGGGSLLIGLGEAARGLVVLAGASYALNMHRRLAHLIARSLVPLAILGSICLVILDHCSSPFLRLLLGFLALLATVPVTSYLMTPNETARFAAVLFGHSKSILPLAREQETVE